MAPTTRKISITIPPDALAAAEREADAAGMSLSAWLAHAAVEAARLAEARRALDEQYAEHGAPDAASLAEAEAALDRAAARAAARSHPATRTPHE